MSDVLKSTVKMMVSSDYKDRFRAEYIQLLDRYEGLKKMYYNWDKLDFTPTCPKEVYTKQLKIMNDYIEILQYRALLENIQI